MKAKRIISGIFLFGLWVLPVNSQEVTDSEKLEDLKKSEDTIIKNAIETGVFVELNADNTSPKKYKINGIVSLGTGLLKTAMGGSSVEESHNYEHITHYNNLVDRELYNDFLQKNKSPIEIDTIDFEDYQVQFASLEKVHQILDSHLEDRDQSEKLKQLFGKTMMIVVSRPGIGHDGTKAMIYLALMFSEADEFGIYGPSGYYIIYGKKNGNWKIIDYVLFG
ncbi:MAG: hypothetical protein LBE91_09095 [Tannerella sp.]|jgi:hypothetical protein|nr:hypothetical protein [Tannerella sp.]